MAWTLISNAAVADGTRSEATDPTGVLIEGDRIKALGSEQELRALVPREAGGLCGSRMPGAGI